MFALRDRSNVKYRNIDIISILVLSITLRILFLGSKSLMVDEGSMILMSRGTLLQVIDGLKYGGLAHPPLQYIFFNLWSQIFANDFGLRLFSVLCSIFTIYFTILSLLKLGIPRKIVVITALLLATSPIGIYYAQNMKINSLAALSVMVAFYAFIGVYIKEKVKSNSILFTLATTFLLYTYYFAPFIVPALILSLLFISSRSKNWYWLKPMALSAVFSFLMFSPWIGTTIHQFKFTVDVSSEEIVSTDTQSSESNGQLGSIKKNIHNIGIYSRVKSIVTNNMLLKYAQEYTVGLKPMIISKIKYMNISGSKLIISLIVVGILVIMNSVLFGYGIYGIFKYKNNNDILLMLSAILPVLSVLSVGALLSILDLMTWESVSRYLTPHHFLFSLPFVVYLIAKGISQIKHKILQSVILSVILTGNLGNIVSIYSSKYTDYRSASHYIVNNWREGDIILGEAFGGGEKIAVYAQGLNAFSYVNYSYYPWAKGNMIKRSQFGIFRGRNIITHDTFDLKELKNSLLEINEKGNVKRIWMMSEKGLIGATESVTYYNWYIDNINPEKICQVNFSSFNVDVYCINLF
jgi:uncharacterized membrane protein